MVWLEVTSSNKLTISHRGTASHNRNSLTKDYFSLSDFCASDRSSSITPQCKAIVGVGSQVSAVVGYRGGVCEKRPRSVLCLMQLVSGSSSGPTKPIGQAGVTSGKTYVRGKMMNRQRRREKRPKRPGVRNSRGNTKVRAEGVGVPGEQVYVSWSSTTPWRVHADGEEKCEEEGAAEANCYVLPIALVLHSSYTTWRG